MSLESSARGLGSVGQWKLLAPSNVVSGGYPGGPFFVAGRLAGPWMSDRVNGGRVPGQANVTKLTSSRHPLRSGATAGLAREQGHCAASRASPRSRHRKRWVARRGRTHCGSQKGGPSPLRFGCSWPARRGCTVAVGKAVLLIRVGQRRLTH
jgi:hypothetical protein